MVKNVSFSENFVNVLNKWSFWQFPQVLVMVKYLEMKHFVVNIRDKFWTIFSYYIFKNLHQIIVTLQGRINEFMMPVYSTNLVLAPCRLWSFSSVNLFSCDTRKTFNPFHTTGILLFSGSIQKDQCHAMGLKGLSVVITDNLVVSLKLS